jgi:hypothetical protein
LAQHVDAVIELLAPRGAALAQRLRLPEAGREFRAADARAAARDHVDDAEHRVLAVNRAARAGDVFDAFDQIHVERKLLPHRAGVVGGVVDAVAIDRDQHAGIEVARQAETTRAEVAVLAVVGGVDAGQAGERLVDRAPAERADFVARNDAHGGRHFALLLLVLRRTGHRQVHQLFETQRRQVRGLRSPGRQPGAERNGEGQRAQQTAGDRARPLRGVVSGVVDHGASGTPGCRCRSDRSAARGSR